MTQEEQLIQRYFDAFNHHDIDGVMACFHTDPMIIDAEGRRVAGRAEVRRAYETSFALFPDGHCDLRSCTGNDGRGMAESFFRGTRPREGKVIEAIGAEVLEIVDGRIKEIRDYHTRISAAVADSASVAEAVHEP
jgi:taurine dehydrogenase small subunit